MEGSFTLTAVPRNLHMNNFIPNGLQHHDMVLFVLIPFFCITFIYFFQEIFFLFALPNVIDLLNIFKSKYSVFDFLENFFLFICFHCYGHIFGILWKTIFKSGTLKWQLDILSGWVSLME